MIYIKGMDMPVDCLACRIACDKESYVVIGRPPDCPLEEAKTGDLISRADAIETVKELNAKVNDERYETICTLDVLKRIESLPSAENSNAKTQNSNQETQNSNGDLIYRADAIKALEANKSDWNNDYNRPIEKDIQSLKTLQSADAVSMGEHVKELNDLASAWKNKFINAEKRTEEIYDETMAKVANECKECKERLRNLRPSADAVQRWIPCSERFPSESGDYLCTIPLDADETYTEVLTFHKGRFYEDDDEWGATYHDDVLAWMPLPTPYREDGEV